MADLGSIATDVRTKAISDQGPRGGLRAVVWSDRPAVIGGREETEANVAPSLRMDARGIWRFRWVVTPGARSISVNVKQAVNVEPRPRLIVKGNLELGTPEVVSVAGSSASWVTVAASVVSSGTGVLEVVLESRYDAGVLGAPTYWDSVVWS